MSLPAKRPCGRWRARAAAGARHCGLLALTGALAAWSGGALAERADRDREVNVTADHSTLDELHQIDVLTGHVVLTKGTMRLTGERMEHHQDDRGYQTYIVTSGPDGLATFHERRDPVRAGSESTLDGVAERIEYSEREDRVVLSKRALVKRLENDVVHDELSGAQIVYDARRSTYEVVGRSGDDGDKVRFRIAPRSAQPSAEAPAQGAQLQSAPTLPGGAGGGVR